MKIRNLIVLMVCLFIEALVSRAAESVLITEVMAINNSGLKDEDNEYSDWVEIYNAGDTAVNLGGWYLTDNDNELTKWQFPPTNLAARMYLVVFASGKNRAVAGAPLHTSFALDGDGEYLALVRPDGVTVAWQFAPRFPKQVPDVSYGLPLLTSSPTTLVSAGAGSKALVPSSDIGTGWTATGYDDMSWVSGTTGVGFDGGTNYTSAIGTDLTAQMLGVNASAYVRVPFMVSDPTAFQELKLRMRYDDGAVGYVNGQEVVRRNAPSPALWNSAATANHGSDTGAAATLQANFDTVTNAHILQQQGTVPAASIQNTNAGSTGRFLRLISDGANSQANCIIFNQVGAGAFPLVVADFDFRIISTDAPADGFAFMLIPTSQYGTSGAGVNPIGAVEDPLYLNVFAVGFDVYDPAGTINDVSANWNGSRNEKVRVPTATLNMTSGQFHHAKVTLRHVTGGAEVTVTLTANINGVPGTPYTAISNRFVPGLNPFSSRVQFGGRTGGLNMHVDLDNIVVQYGYPTGLVPFEEFDISGSLSGLQSGANVLAIHGLNLAASDPDFLVLPELSARSITVQTNERNFFATATPGAANASGAALIAEAPMFSIPGGVYTSNLVVALSTSVPGGVIRYTLNGTKPSAGSPVYSTAFSVSNSTAIRAMVFAPGYLPSAPATASYTMLDATATNFTSNLPLIILDTYNRVISQDMNPRAPVTMTIIDTMPTTGRASLLGKRNFQGRAGIEVRGQTSAGFPKKPYNIEIWDEEDDDKDVAILGFPAGSDFALLNVYNDKTFMNDFLAFEYFEKMGHYSVRRRFVEVFLNGLRPENNAADPSGRVGSNDYVGIFVLLEKIRVDKDRVDIAKLEPEHNTEPEITGGYVWKKDKGSPSDVVFTTLTQTGTDPASESLKWHDPRFDELTAVQRTWLVNHLNEFETVLFGPNKRDPVNGYAKYIDMDTFVDSHWIVEFTKQIDGYRLSSYFTKDRGGKIKMAPIWDWNLSFGNANYLNGGHTNGWYYALISSAQHIYLRQLVGDGGATAGDPDFLQKTIDRWGELRQDIFALSNVLARVDEIAAFLNEAQARDFARWPRLGTYLWPNPNGTAGGWHVDYQNPGTYAGIIQEMKKWITGRYNWIDGLYLKKPLLSRNGGSPGAPLGMFATVGTIYYTVDGSDPRLPGGVISPNARVYTNYFVPPANSQIFARAWHTNAWSPPVTAAFGYGVPSLVITEIMYHPANSTDTNFNDEDFEFIEIKNTGTSPMDLTGLRFADGIDFVFPPGPLQPTGSPTAQNFDAAGAAYTTSTLGAGPGASIASGGGAGNFMRLAHQGTGTNRNRVAFDQTATGPYDRMVAEFDFRGNNASAPLVTGAATLQNFEGGGATYTTINYAGPQAPTVTAGDSGSQGSFMRITPAVNGEMDGVFFNRTSVGVFNTVIATFDFRMAGGADGMGFVFLNTATHGTSGNVSAGFGEEPNVANAIGVGFDIYPNGTTAQEPNGNHISLHSNGVQVGAAVTPGLSLAAGRFHRAQITIKFEASRALVTVKITPDINGAGGTPETLFTDMAINGVTAFEGRVGFAARTGGLNAAQDIDNINIQYLNGPIPTPGGLALALLPASIFGTSGAGTTLANYADLPNAANLFAVNFDMHSSSLINDASAHWNGSTRGNAAIPAAALDLDNNQFHRARLEVLRVNDGARISLTVTPEIYGILAQPPRTIFSNLLVNGFFPGNSRIELAARSGGQNIAIDADNLNVTYERYAPVLLAAGECGVIVNNRAAFESIYGMGIRILGEYSGALDNGGERLLLLGLYGEPILDFRYNDDWYPITDGFGFSLVLPDSNLPINQWSDPANWRPSTQVNGSPGAIDPPPATFGAVLVNEALTRSAEPLIDAIELHNPETNSVDASGWYLSDDFNTPRKYRLPAGTVIPAGSYVVIYETNFSAMPASSNSFSLRAEGDEVYLFSANTVGDLTGYFHGHEFDLVDRDVSLGRHITSEGKEHFVAQSSRTLGAANSGPLVGPVVISEIMYHPPDYASGVDNQEDEFIELLNTSGSLVALYDPAYPANTWRLRDAVRFDFPPDTTIAAGERILVVSFDPVWEPALLAAFRGKYNVSPSVTVLGPYEGKLDNSSDSVELVKPDAPDLDTANIDYILVDKVQYDDDSPWPLAADGLGRSLQRVDTLAYGNDPANWAAALPTPAAAYVPGAAPIISAQPADQVVTATMSAEFSVGVGGLGPFTYQWRFNGNNLGGATGATLTLSRARLSDAGQYQVVVMSSTGSAESTAATLTVLQSATFVTQPQGRTVILSTNMTNVTFSAMALGNGPVSYQWRFNGADLAGATSSNYTVVNVGTNSGGFYSVVATDAVGAASSAPALLTVLVSPGILRQPQPVVAVQGDTVTFSVIATGTEPLGYRWRRSANDLTTPRFLPNPSYTMVNVQSTNAGNYDVIITNAAFLSPGLRSAVVALIVLADTDGDHVPDVWENTYGFSPTNSMDGAIDSDGDTASNLHEYIAGTNPTNAASYLKIDQLTPGSPTTLRFMALSNKTYTVYLRDSLDSGGWTRFTDVLARTNNRVEILTDTTPAASRRYYRLQTPFQQ